MIQTELNYGVEDVPEGPEIKKVAISIEKYFLNKKLNSIFFKFPDLKPYENELKNEILLKSESKGKALLLTFSNQLVMYSHNQLYGKWYIKSNKVMPKTSRDLRAVLECEDCSAYLFSASEIEILASKDVSKHPYLRKLGLDVFDLPSDTEIVQKLYSKKFLNRSLGNLLLDQSFIAGMGNYLRSEALFFMSLNPKQKFKSLTQQDAIDLYRECQRLSQQSLQNKGITNDLNRVKQLKKEGFKRSQYRHAVFTRAGQACYICNSNIEKINIASRRLYYCSQCQSR